MNRKGKMIQRIKTAVSLALVPVAAACVIQRVPEVFSNRDTALAAAAFTLSDGKLFAESGTEPATAAPSAAPVTQPVTGAAKEDRQPAQRDKSGYYDSFGKHDGEARYTVDEKTIYPDGTEVDGCYVKNYTDLTVDFNASLQQPLSFQLSRGTDSPQVLIYHTHTGEAYMDEDVDYFYESYESRTSNNAFNVVAVGNAVAAALEKKGIKVLHDTTVHDSTYDGSYDRSAQTVRRDMEQYPSLQLVLDIHRDALGSDECKVKTVFEHNGKKGAQMMILAGCDPDNERNFSHWEKNLSLAMKIQHTAEKLYPGMTRPLDFGYFAYNEYICDGSLLIEIGTDGNTVAEAEYTGELLGGVLTKVFDTKLK